jgi:hypothetical protein
MIFEDAYIKNLLKCNKCNEKLIDQPRSLPCGKIICSVCIIKIEQESINSKFECICFEYHEIPKKGFGISEIALNLLQYQQLKINLQKIETLSRDLKITFHNESEKDTDITEYSNDKIKEHCNEQRGLVNMAIENKIQELNKINEETMAKIDEFEMMCKKSFSGIDISFKKKLDQVINEANTFLNEKKAYLKQIQLNEEVLTNFNKQAEHLQGELNKELNILKSKIFGKKLIRFNSNLEKIDSKIIGFIDYDSLMSPV